MTTQVIIAGGGYAGLFAAARLRRFPGLRVTLIDSKDHFEERVRWHEYVVGRSSSRLSYRDLLEPAGFAFIKGLITELDPDNNTLTVNGSQVLHYDKLLYGLGSRTRESTIPGVSAYALTFEQREVVKTRLQAQMQGQRVVVLGAGMTGLETATEIKESHPHLQVLLVSAGKAFSGYSKGGEREIRRVLQRLGIDLLEQSSVTQLTPDACLLADGRILPFDLAINCMGFEVPGLARSSGIRCNGMGQIQVDEYLRSLSHPSIFAIGDCAEIPAMFVQTQRMSCALACPMGTHAADMLHRLQKSRDLLPFQFGFIGQCISLGRKAALVQMVRPDDSPRTLYVRGRLAVWIKELVCLGTVKFPLWELRWGLALFVWLQPKGKRT